MSAVASSIAALKAQFPSLTTADKIALPASGRTKEPRPAYSPLRPLEIEEWPEPRLAALEILGPVALYVASAERPVSVALLARDGSGEVWAESWVGGNPGLWESEDLEGRLRGRPRGVWPVKLGISGRYRDTITRSLDRDPYVKWALRRRVWALDVEIDRDGEQQWGPGWLLSAARAGLAEAAQEAGYAQLLHGYIDAGPRFQPYGFEQGFVIPLAQEAGVKVWSEEALGKFLQRALKRAAARGITRRHEGAFRDLCLALMQEEAEAAHALKIEKSEQQRVTADSATSYPMKRQGYDPETERQIEEVMRKKKALAQEGARQEA